MNPEQRAALLAWHDDAFPHLYDPPPAAPGYTAAVLAAKLAEETGEAARVLVSAAERRDRGDLADELADVMIVCEVIAGWAGIDLAGAVSTKLARVLGSPPP